MVFCDECNFHFCYELHALHSRHSLQMLRVEQVEKRPASEHAGKIDDDDEVAEEVPIAWRKCRWCACHRGSAVVNHQHSGEINDDASTSMVTEGSDDQRWKRYCPRNEEGMVSNIQFNGTSLLAPLRSVHDNSVSRQSWESDKLNDAVGLDVRSQLLREGENGPRLHFIMHLISLTIMILYCIYQWIGGWICHQHFPRCSLS